MNPGSNNRALMLGGVMLGGILAALFLGRAVAYGDYTRAAIVIVSIFGVLAVLALGNRYWYMIPVTIGLSLPTFQLGARNINLAELSVALCALIFAVRFALKRETLDILRLRNVPIYAYFAWVMMVWALHPVGLAGFGSDIGGGRFYATILLAMAAFLIVSNQKFVEADIRWIFLLLVVGSIANLGRTFTEYALLGRTLGVVQQDLDTEGYYTWHQELAGPAMIVAMVMLSRFKPSEIFTISHPWRLATYVMSFVPILLSGKRAAVGMFLLYPLVSAVLRREFRYVMVFAIFAGMGISVLLLGQGTYFHLPLNAQRALSWLPAQWDSEMAQYRGGSDDFRQALREIAIDEIKQDPWIADGFQVDISDTAAAYYQALQFGTFGDIRNQVMPYALGKAWHNTWLGYAADFGIPLSVIQAFVMLVGIWMAYTGFRLTQEGTWMQAMTVYCFMFFLRDVLLSNTSGHSANDAFGRWWMYGMVFAIVDACRRSRATKPLPKQSKVIPQNPVTLAANG